MIMTISVVEMNLPKNNPATMATVNYWRAQKIKMVKITEYVYIHIYVNCKSTVYKECQTFMQKNWKHNTKSHTLPF